MVLKKCLLAFDVGSQPYSRVVRYGEMAGEEDTHIRNLADMQGTTSTLCHLPQGQAIIITLSQPFAFPRVANSDRWFETPKGISVWLATIV